jgi:subtilisin-like proprotein convertase family protein
MRNTARIWVVASLIVVVMGGLLLQASPAAAWSYTQSPLALVNRSYLGAITVPDIGTVTEVTVSVAMAHTHVGDLVINLHPPSGMMIQLWPATCGSLDNLNITFSESAATPVNASCGNQSNGGTYNPNGNLNAFNGNQAVGTWRLEINDLDNVGTVPGTLASWSLNITATAPPGPVPPPEPEYIAPQINDGRLNRYDVVAPVGVYPAGDGFNLYTIDPVTGAGTFTAAITPEMLAREPAADFIEHFAGSNPITGAPMMIYILPDGRTQLIRPTGAAGGHLLLWEGVHPATGAAITVQRLTSGEMQITMADVAGGEPYIFIW